MSLSDYKKAQVTEGFIFWGFCAENIKWELGLELGLVVLIQGMVGSIGAEFGDGVGPS